MKLTRILKQARAQQKQIAETIASSKVICDNCGWSWAIEDGTDDGETNPYLCHKCDHDNRPKKPKKK
jgi:hypothetical protein